LANLPASFNPRPPLLAGDAVTTWGGRYCWQLFQSAPAIAGGRCPQQLRPGVVVLWRFNPRPPLLAGDARV